MNDLSTRLIDLAVAIQQIPAPTLHEDARAEFVRLHFSKEGLADVEMDSVGNVFARLPGRDSKKSLVVSAHLDTVFLSNIDLHVSREPGHILAPGIGDNSIGVAGLFGLVWALRDRHQVLPGDLWLAANVCEEGLGNLRGIRAVVDRFGSLPLAYIVLEGMALGQVYNRGLGVRRYRITVRSAGGHSWIDYGKPSAIHELTALSTRIAALEPPRLPRTDPQCRYHLRRHLGEHNRCRCNAGTGPEVGGCWEAGRFSPAGGANGHCRQETWREC